MPEKPPILEAVSLSYRFPNGSFGLREVSFTVAENDFLLIAGANGSGKTLLMRHLNGLLSPVSGKVFFRGKPVAGNLREVRRKVGLVFQDADSQIIGQSVRDDVAFGPENLNLYQEEIDRRVEYALMQCGIERHADSDSRSLSGGEKRLLAIAGVLAMEPEVIILDEPFANLDYAGIRRVLALVLRLHEDGHTIILITHEIEKVMAHARRLIIMRGGRIAADAPPQELSNALNDFDLVPPDILAIGMDKLSWHR